MAWAERRAREGSARILAPLTVVWTLGMAVVALTGIQPSATRALLLLDPVTSARLPWYAGLVSDVGILGWAVAASAAAATAFVASVGMRRGAAWFFGHGAVLGTVLCADDLLQLHAELAPDVLGLPKVAALGALALATGHWVLQHHRELRRTRWPLLVAAGSAFAVSLAVDQLGSGAGRSLLAEDGAKLFGILAWSGYFVVTGIDVVRSVVADARRGEPRSPSPPFVGR
jgi:hypothetical protein